MPIYPPPPARYNLKGSGLVDKNGIYKIPHSRIANDRKTEGTETLNIKLFTDSARRNQVGNTTTVNINDIIYKGMNKNEMLDNINLSLDILLDN